MSCCNCPEVEGVESTITGCNIADPANPVAAIEHLIYAPVDILSDASGLVLYPVGSMIPVGAEVVYTNAEGSVESPDGSGFYRSFYTDTSGTVLDPAAVVWSEDCKTAADADTEVVSFIDPNNPEGGLTSAIATTTIDPVTGEPVVTYWVTDPVTGELVPYDPVAEGTELVTGSADFEYTESCFVDPVTGDKVSYRTVYFNGEPTTYDAAGAPIADTSTLGTPVACNGEEKPIAGCIKVENGDGTFSEFFGYQWIAYADGVPTGDIRYTDTLLATSATATDGTTVDTTTATIAGFKPGIDCCAQPTFTAP